MELNMEQYSIDIRAVRYPGNGSMQHLLPGNRSMQHLLPGNGSMQHLLPGKESMQLLLTMKDASPPHHECLSEYLHPLWHL
jgi:hypothetical protein